MCEFFDEERRIQTSEEFKCLKVTKITCYNLVKTSVKQSIIKKALLLYLKDTGQSAKI